MSISMRLNKQKLTSVLEDLAQSCHQNGVSHIDGSGIHSIGVYIGLMDGVVLNLKMGLFNMPPEFDAGVSIFKNAEDELEFNQSSFEAQINNAVVCSAGAGDPSQLGEIPSCFSWEIGVYRGFLVELESTKLEEIHLTDNEDTVPVESFVVTKL